MSQRGALSPKKLHMLGGVPERCSCKSVPFYSCWLSLLHYRSGVPESNYEVYGLLNKNFPDFLYLVVCILNSCLKLVLSYQCKYQL